MSTDDTAVSTDELGDLLSRVLDAKLESLTPENGVESYIRSNEDELADSTIRTHKSRLSFFLDWCEQNAIDNLNDLSGRDIHNYRQHRKEDIATSTLASHMHTLRCFLRHCVQIDAVDPRLPDAVDIPTIPDHERSRDDMIDSDWAADIIDHLDKYEYASFAHVEWVLLVETGMRACEIHSLDLNDIDFDRDPDGNTQLTLRHRPDSGTRLKNNKQSERTVIISEHTATVIRDYIDHHRLNKTDDHGRQPLLTTRYGRPSKTWLRDTAYAWSRPCVIGRECPVGKTGDDIDDCEAMEHAGEAHHCPASYGTHAIRRGYITSELDAGVPDAVVSGRCDVTPDVIAESYDERTQTDKARLRQEIRDEIYSNRTGYGKFQE